MILILSTPTDHDTQTVIDWLYDSNAPFFRLNDEDIMTGNTSFNLNPKNIQNSYIQKDNQKIFFKDIKVVWFRKFGFFLSYKDTFGKNSDLTKYIYSEFAVIRTNILSILKDKIWLNNRLKMLTKLEIIYLANEFGLNTPNSIVTSQKEVLTPFFLQNNSSLITKSIGDGNHIVFKNVKYPCYTQHITNINEITEKFSPSLFQAYIDKKYELRIFFLDGEFYSMVIFSQNNEKTKIDFRNYDFDFPNRKEPYRLPNSIESKLSMLMNKIGLNTGSIDMIKGLDDNYYFLEINPSGQFGMTGLPCNYNLHKKIANFLIKKLNSL